MSDTVNLNVQAAAMMKAVAFRLVATTMPFILLFFYSSPFLVLLCLAMSLVFRRSMEKIFAEEFLALYYHRYQFIIKGKNNG